MVNLTISEMLFEILNDLNDIGDIQASAIFSNDGLVMVSCTEYCDFSVDVFGAMGAVTMGAAENAARNLNKGEMKHLMLKITKGNIFTMKASSDAILTLITELNENDG